MNKVPIDVEENEIDIKELFFSIYQHKFMIFLFVVIFGLASAYYAYFLPNIYRATASVKVGLDEDEYAKDVISMAMGKGAVNAATEKDLIKSRYLSEKALKKVDFRQHYYSTINFKEIELYKDSPIKVTLKRGYGVSFDVEIIDNEHYRLVVYGNQGANASVFEYEQIHKFSELVNTDDFELSIDKIKETKEKKYRFVIDENKRSFSTVSAAQNLENSTILQISVEDIVPLRAKEYANALAEAYIEQNIENKTREAMQRLSFIENQLDTVSKNIKVSASKLEDFRKESKMVNVERTSETISSRLESYEADLMELLVREEMLGGFYKQVKSSKKIETLSIEGIEDKESILADLMQKLQVAIVEQKELRQDYTDLHPLLKKLNRKIAQIKSTIINTADNLVKNLEKRKELLSENIKKQKVLLNTLPENERRYGQLERKFKMNEEINTYLMKRKAEAEMIRASTVSKNRILDRALLPHTPIKPKRETLVFIGLLLGFIAGIFVAFIRVFLDTKIQNENDISQSVDYPILGSIPHLDVTEEGWKGKIKVFEEVKSAVAESFRHLRSNLQFISKQEGSQIILLTSTVGQEGKTTIAVNLAAIMSLSKKRTIIINLDMRKPTMHEKFDLPNQAGMSELLNERVQLDDVIQETRYPYLNIISSGVIPPNPSELIQSEKMYEILEQLKHDYDMIILDTPPIGLVTDVKELMYYVDINIYIVRADYSRKEFLENLKKFNFTKKVQHLGIVLNDVKPKKGNYGYYTGYGYGYYEEKKSKRTFS